MSVPGITILPAQAARISREVAKTGAAIGVSQSGNILTLDTGLATFSIDAGGFNLNPNQEQLPC